MRRLAVLATLSATAASGAAVGVAATVADPGANPEVRVSAGRGILATNSSGDDEAILHADDLRPGGVVTGTATVSNDGDEAGAATLSATDLQDVPGPGGAPLSARLVLEISDASAATVYRGTLTGMPPVALGDYAPGEQRTYLFRAALLNGDPATDDALQGAATRVTFRWTLEGHEAVATPPGAPLPVQPVGDARTEQSAAESPPHLTLARAADSWRPARGRLGVTARCDRACVVVAEATLVAGRSWRLPGGRLRLGRGAGTLVIRVPATVRRAALQAARRHALFLHLRVTATADDRTRTSKTLRLLVQRPRRVRGS